MEGRRHDVVAQVDDELIAEVLPPATGIPIFKLTEESRSGCSAWRTKLHKRVIGQEQAIHARLAGDPPDPRRVEGPVVPAVRSSSPAPGVGKTELSKTLAEFLFGDEDA